MTITILVALSGGIGSGKSTVSELFAKLGAVVVDADAIVHELQAPGAPMLAEIAALLGPEVVDSAGALDRAAVADRVFRDPELRAALGQIVHPKVGIEMQRRTQAAQAAGAPMVVLDIPLLFEGVKAARASSQTLPYDATVAVWAPVEIQIKRALARDGCSLEEAERRIEAQLPLAEKCEMADHVIDNAGSLEETERQVAALFEALTGSAEK